MESPILADVTASVTELLRDPMGMAASGSGSDVAVALEILGQTGTWGFRYAKYIYNENY